MKVCSKCHKAKPLAKFSRSGERRRADCKACDAERHARSRLPGAGIAAKDTGGLTHKEIAVLLGLSRARVQQIESRAMAKIRAAMTEGWR